MAKDERERIQRIEQKFFMGGAANGFNLGPYSLPSTIRVPEIKELGITT